MTMEPLSPPPAAHRRPCRWLFLLAALALLNLVPVWSVPFVPTADGMSHIANTFILRHLDEPGYAVFRAHYETHLLPLPNWLYQAFVLGLPAGLDPLIADGLFQSLYVLLFVAAVGLFVAATNPGAMPMALAGSLLVWNFPYLEGFTNFAIGMPLFLLALTWWWRRRDAWGARETVVLAGLLVAIYFCHLIPAAAALAALPFLAIGHRPSRRPGQALLLAAALAPAGGLCLWYFLAAEKLPGVKTVWTLGRTLGNLVFMQTVVAHHDREYLVAAGLLLVYGLGGGHFLRGLRTSWRPGLGQPFLLLTVGSLLVYLLAPDRMGGGFVIKVRLLLFPLLLALGFLPWPWTGRASRLAIGLLVALHLANVSFRCTAFRTLHQELASCLAATSLVQPDRTFLPLVFDTQGPSKRAHVLLQGFALYAAQPRLVNLANFEAASVVFPLRYRPGMGYEARAIDALMARPEEVRIDTLEPRPDAIFTYAMPEDSPVAGRIRAGYDLVYGEGRVRIFSRRRE
ncbi:MAG: hypothetical protein AB1634_08415 [Thermodesulfobacteriota bacterium]